MNTPFEYKQLYDYPEYEINCCGIIRSIFTHDKINSKLDNCGNQYYLLYKKGESFHQFAHVLVATYFLPNPSTLPYVERKDGDYSNCRIENLEWASRLSCNHWDIIDGFEGYEINRVGQIRNIITKRVLGKNLDFSGYHCVSLYKDKIPHRKSVHILVATQYIPNPDNKPIVTHIDGDRSNNCVYNLEWALCVENNRHSARGSKIAQRVSKPLNEYGLDGEYIRTWISATAYAQFYGLNRVRVSECARGNAMTVSGHIVRYYDGNTNDIVFRCRYSYVNRQHKIAKEVPKSLLFFPPTLKEEAMAALERPLYVSCTKNTLLKDIAIVKEYIENLEKKIQSYEDKNV